jgi:outer membrane protein assembly factor BamB
VIPCTPEQASPYADGTAFLGVHANPSNNDIVECETGSEFVEVWHALEGMGLTQPNTFSPDGNTLYATSTNPEPEGCRLWALDADTGEVKWCQSHPSSISQGAVEVDEDGLLYFTADADLMSLTPDGELRWTVSFEDVNGEKDAPWGVHFTPDGHVATVTSSGVVYLVRREDGQILDSLSIAEAWGFVPPATMDMDIDLTPLLPRPVQDNIVAVWGEEALDGAGGGFGALLGAGSFCDNTVGISDQGDIYVIGGGPDPDHGALVQLRVEGTADEPKLVKGWFTETHAGSATSPSISGGGRYVVIGDGSSSDTFMNPENVEAVVKVMDIEACDGNTDADPDPARCAVAYSEDLERSPMVGAPAIAEDGTVYLWEFGLDLMSQPEDRDLVAFGPEGLIWQAVLPDNLDWNSVMIVTENHLVGTASVVTPSEYSLFAVTFPQTTEDYTVVVDRFTGELLWKGPQDDDGTATTAIGKDGSLYTALRGFLSTLSIADKPTLGLVKFSPTKAP